MTAMSNTNNSVQRQHSLSPPRTLLQRRWSKMAIKERLMTPPSSTSSEETKKKVTVLSFSSPVYDEKLTGPPVMPVRRISDIPLLYDSPSLTPDTTNARNKRNCSDSEIHYHNGKVEFPTGLKRFLSLIDDEDEEEDDNNECLHDDKEHPVVKPSATTTDTYSSTPPSMPTRRTSGAVEPPRRKPSKENNPSLGLIHEVDNEDHDHSSSTNSTNDSHRRCSFINVEDDDEAVPAPPSMPIRQKTDEYVCTAMMMFPPTTNTKPREQFSSPPSQRGILKYGTTRCHSFPASPVSPRRHRRRTVQPPKSILKKNDLALSRW